MIGCVRMRLATAVVGYALTGMMIFAANAQTNEQVIKYRQAIMQAIAGNMAAISAILKGRMMHQENLVEHARQLKSASTLFESAFRKEIWVGRTDARPEIWDEWDEYLALAKKMGEESDRLADIGANGSMRTILKQVKALVRSCGECHEEFRRPKAESYK